MKPKVIVIDDDRSVRESLVKLIQLEKHSVLSAAGGAEVIHMICSEPIDLVVFGMTSTSKNRWEVFEQMKAAQPNLPILVITDEFEPKDKTATVGADVVMEKPMDVQVFLSQLRNLASASAELCHI